MNNIIKAIALCIQVGIPVLLWGKPGVGKSASLNALAVKLSLAIEVIIASLREPSDFAGLPYIVEGEVRLAPPAWAKRLVNANQGILFLDEITTASPSVQAALLRVVLDRVVGDIKLPDAISIVAAANPPEIAAGGYELTAPMGNRFCHIDWELDPREWSTGMRKGWKNNYEDIGPLPDNWQDELNVTRELVASFIDRLPHMLLDVPKEESQAGKAWPSGRSWDAAATILAACRVTKVETEVTTLLIRGLVGDGPAIAFMNWLSELDLPDADNLINRGQFEFNQFKTRHDKVQCILTSIVVTLKRSNSIDRYYNSLKLCCQAAQAGFIDIAFPAANSVVQLMPVGAASTISEMSVFGDLNRFMKQAN